MGALHRKTNNNISICSPANIISALPCVQGYTFPLQGADAFLLSGLRVEAGPALPVVLPSQAQMVHERRALLWGNSPPEETEVCN